MRKLTALLCLVAATTACSNVEAQQARAQTITTREVRFESNGVTLVGTLYIPNGAKNAPGVAVLHGSGKGGRNTGYGLVAEKLAERGIVALAYDKRGVGESGGRFSNAPALEELGDDGLAAFEQLIAAPEVDPNRAGIAGYSQGGWLCHYMAAKSEKVRFLATMSGPPMSSGEQIIFDRANRLRTQGVPEDQIKAFSEFRRGLHDYFRTGQGYEELSSKAQELGKYDWFKGLFKPVIPQPSAIPPELAKHVNFDPIPYIRKINVPFIAFFGRRDDLLPGEKCANDLKALFDGERAGLLTVHLTNHDHFYQPTDGWFMTTLAAWVKQR